tara:strand:- start:46 stop:1224 length:1179 start_codon:yes stop_codon:yes gene_type:complete
MQGIREVKRGKLYRIDLRSIDRGVATFEGSALEAHNERERRISESKRIRPAHVLNHPRFVAVAYERFIDLQKERRDDGEIGQAEYVNKKMHGQRMCDVIFKGKPVGSHELLDLTYDDLRGPIKKSMTENKRGNKELSLRTIKSNFVTIKQFFKWCVARGWLSISPAELIKVSLRDSKPSIGRRIHPGEMAAVILAASPFYRREITFAAYTGVRAGEQVALTWDDIDLKDGYIDINKARKKAEIGNLIGTPKTSHGVREIKMTENLRQMLREWKLEQPRSMRHKNLVFPTKTGEHADHSNWYKRGLIPACKAAEVERIIWKDLRNFYASVLIFSKTLADKEVAAWLGHSDSNFTYKQYARYYRDRDRDDNIINVLDDAFGTSAIKTKNLGGNE